MPKQLFTCGFLGDFQSRYWFLLKLIILITACLLCGSIDTPAQKPRKHKKIPAKIIAGTVPPKAEKIEDTGNNSSLPISVVPA